MVGHACAHSLERLHAASKRSFGAKFYAVLVRRTVPVRVRFRGLGHGCRSRPTVDAYMVKRTRPHPVRPFSS